MCLDKIERTNFLRFFCVFIDIGTETLLKLFLHFVPQENVVSFFSSDDVRRKCGDLQSRKILTKKQLKIISHSCVDIYEFDVSLFIVLLSNLFPDKVITPPQGGWETNRPRNDDLSLAADIIRLRILRNAVVGHSTRAKLSDVLFQNLWGELETIVIRLHTSIGSNLTLYRDKIQSYKTLNLDAPSGNQYEDKLENLKDIVKIQEKVADILQKSQGLPPEILRKDERSIELYKQALAEGSVPDYSIRVMIVGHSNVGKTTLKRRLFDETVDIKKRKSTNGIEVHVGHCKVNIKSGEWIVQEKDGRLETLSQRLCELLSRNRPPSKPHNDTKERERDEKKSSNSPSNDSSSSSTPPSPNGSAAEFLEPPGTKETNDAMDISSMDDEEECLSDLKEILEQSSKIETIQHTSELSIWDFAGQSDYYAMHQVFLSRRAVYLLVTKLTEHISDTVDVHRLVDSTGRNYFKISDLIHFWLNSIYEHMGKDDSYDPTRHNVILVGTHADQMTENSEDNSGSDFFDTVRMNLHDQVTFDLLTELDFRVNNTIDPTDPSSTISDLRKYIIETASKQSYWGKLIPAKWCNLEKILLKLQNQGSKILKLSDVMELNKILPVALRSDEIELFLQVHHERGNILYYGKDHQLNEYIILEPQWLIDAFKSIVTSRSFCCKKKNIAKMYKEFEQTAVLQKQLIDSIWEQENYSEFKHHSVLILCFMEKLGLIAKPYQAAMPESTLRTAEYFVPYFLTKRVPVEILKAEGSKANYTSKLCITTKSGFFPNTIFNKLLAACIQSFKISGPPETKHIYCGCGVFDVGTSCYQMFVCFADNVIHIWLSSLSTHEDQNYSECKMICDFIMKVLRKDLNEVVTFYKCWKSSVESKFKLLKEDLLGNNEVICYCQNDGHPVKAWEITKFWETGSYKEDTPGSSGSSKTMSGYPLRKIHDDTLSESCVNALSEKMKSVGALITSKGLGTVFRVGTKYVMTAYHVVQPLVKIDFDTNHINASALKNNSVFVNFNESLLDHEDRIYRLTDNIFFDVELDFAILEISNPDHLLPASLQLCFDAFEIMHLKEVSLIGYGHPNELGKHLDPRCKILSPNDEQIQTAMTWFNQNSSFLKSKQHGIAELVEKGYGKINHPDKLIFHCYMQQGGSGSPALSHRHADSVCVVGMLTHCEPEAYFFLTDANEKMFNKEYLFEMGPKMSSIFERIRDKIPTEVAKDIFNL